MAGTKAGSAKALATIRERHGEAFFKKIGHMGGTSIVNRNPVTGKALKGFAISGKASEAGKIGGARKRVKNGVDETSDSDI
jgi:DUF917 family protein